MGAIQVSSVTFEASPGAINNCMCLLSFSRLDVLLGWRRDAIYSACLLCV